METQTSRADQYLYRTQRNDLKQHADKIIQGIKKIGPNHAKSVILPNCWTKSWHC
jgi:hypothetical protein